MWVDMEDASVRATHARADGQVVPVGGRFRVGETTLAYPGEPNAALSEIMNCRCVVRPASQSGEAMTANTFVLADGAFAATQDAPGLDEDLPEQRTGALVTLLPAAGDPINAASSEDMAHMTFIWMGDLMNIEADTLSMAEEVRRYA